MPKLSVWMVRASLLHMGVGFLFGALILYHKGIPIDGWVWKLLNPHIDLVIFGWTMQFVMGIAFFALPRFSHREQRYGAVNLGWFSFFVLNAGILTTASTHWLGAHEYTLVGQMLVLVGVVAFVVMIWPRVKPFGVI